MTGCIFSELSILTTNSKKKITTGQLLIPFAAKFRSQLGEGITRVSQVWYQDHPNKEDSISTVCLCQYTHQCWPPYMKPRVAELSSLLPFFCWVGRGYTFKKSPQKLCIRKEPQLHSRPDNLHNCTPALCFNCTSSHQNILAGLMVGLYWRQLCIPM